MQQQALVASIPKNVFNDLFLPSFSMRERELMGKGEPAVLPKGKWVDRCRIEISVLGKKKIFPLPHVTIAFKTHPLLLTFHVLFVGASRNKVDHNFRNENIKAEEWAHSVAASSKPRPWVSPGNEEAGQLCRGSVSQHGHLWADKPVQTKPEHQKWNVCFRGKPSSLIHTYLYHVSSKSRFVYLQYQFWLWRALQKPEGKITLRSSHY